MCMYVEEIVVVTPVMHVENQGYFFGSVHVQRVC